MEIGKLNLNDLKKNIINEIKFKRDDVLLHSGIGEDSAVVDFGDEVLVISSDPITGAVKDAGYIAVHVTCNDIAAAGAKPVGIQVVLLLPETTKEEYLSKLMKELHDTARDLNVEILGGHTEIVSSVQKPIIVTTGIGKTSKSNYIATGGAKPGDDIILTKGIGIEGTYILANDYSDYLIKKGVSVSSLEKAKKFKYKLSVVKEGMIAASFNADSLHDITEGGLYGALDEISSAANAGFEIYIDKILIDTCTREITDAVDIDPFGLISSGSMLITTNNGRELIEKLEKEGIKASVIGNVKNKGKYIGTTEGNLDDFSWNGEDELWRFMRDYEKNIK